MTKLSRRMFLGGAAATVALPWLPSLAPRSAVAADAPPTRLLFFYVPNGFLPGPWAPAAGSQLVLGPTHQGLVGLEDQLLLISGLHNLSARGDRAGDHARGTGSFLSCQPCLYEGIENGITIDQEFARAWQGRTAFSSLELGTEGGGSVALCDSGYACAYTQNISWTGPTTPAPKLTSPRVVFDRLFAGSDGPATAAEAARRRVYRASVLDLVDAQARSLQGRLAMADRHRLDEYLTGVRALEEQVERLGECSTDSGTPEDEVPLDQVADVMLDLVANAFRCDLTRVASFMLANAGSNRVYGFLPGVRGAHHEVSHHQDAQSNLDQLALIERWEVDRLGRFLRRLQGFSEGEGSLLDHTTVVFSSEIGDGNRHNHDNLPVLVAGKGGGVVGTGRHLVAQDQPIANLFLGLAEGLGVDLGSFGADGTEPLAGLAG